MQRRSFGLLGLLGLAFVATSSVADAQRVDRNFTVINHTGSTISHLFVSPTSVTTWGPDQLGTNVLPNDGSLSLQFRPRNYRGQCVFDIKVRIDGHDSAVSGINLCTINTVTFTAEDGHVAYTAE